MRVRLKGINLVRKRLANGQLKTYYYAWKGGPRLKGEPGTPQFIDSYNAAIASARRPQKREFRSIIDQYLDSPEFLNLADATRHGYRAEIKVIEAEFGDLPLSAFSDRQLRGVFLDWRNQRGKKSPRQADHGMQVLARIISWACNRGDLEVNPCTRPGRLYKGERSDKIWTDEQLEAFYEKAPAHLHLALALGFWTGQRQRDLLRLRWSDYDGTHIRLRQKKKGAYVRVPVAQQLKRALDARKAQLQQNEKMKACETILTTTRYSSWTGSGFHSSWDKACEKAGVVGVTYHDLRGTAVTRLALAGSTVPQIASLTGHSLKDVEEILDRHYLGGKTELAEQAIRKLERRTKRPTKRPTRR
jgi:integrase